MGVPLLQRKGRFSSTEFSGSGREAYDLEGHLVLPAPSETIFDLRRDNAGAFVSDARYLLIASPDLPVQIFSNEIVRSSTYGPLNVTFGKEQKFGWTSFRDSAIIKNIYFNEDKGSVQITAWGGDGWLEKDLALDSMPKFAFLRKRTNNPNMHDPVALYLSLGSPQWPFTYRSQYVYMVKG